MIRVAVAGFGYWGPNLVRNFQNLSDSELAVCCDLDEARLASVQQRYAGIRTTTRFDDVLDDRSIDAVVVATPARAHFAMVRKALLHGKHVLVEKPLAMTVAESEELLDVARRKDLVLMVGHTFLYSPAVNVLKDIVRSRTLGDLRLIHSQRLNLGRVQSDINAMWSLAPHDVSIVLHLLDEMPVEVSAQGGSYMTPGIEDVVFMNLRFQSGVMANIHVSWLDPRKVRAFTLIGSRQMAEYDDTAPQDKIRILDKRAIAPASGRGPFELHSGGTATPVIPSSEPLANECQHFIDCIREGRQPITDGVNGLQVVQVLEAAQCSLKDRGQPVEIAAAGRLQSLASV